MDAKPQRPIRSVRVGGDENLLPNAHPTKTLHRNKSSPALSSMSNGLKAAAKRTAFGDLSNVIPARMNKDDSSLPSKDSHFIVEKPYHITADKKSATLLRPAQRPTSVAVLKAHPASAVNVSAVDTLLPSQQANSRKHLAKKSTAIFKDPSSIPVNTAPVPDRKPEVFVPNSFSEQPHSRISHQQTAPDNGKRQAKATVKVSVKSNNNELERIDPADYPRTSRSDSAHIIDEAFSKSDMASEVRSDSTSDARPYERICDDDKQVSVAYEVQRATAMLLNGSSEPVEEFVPAEQAPARHSIRGSHTTNLTEPEEYWPEDDEENYEDDGYVTARSYYSRGDNTTGGATTVLFPRTTNNVKKELAAAKIHVEATRTPEDVEDEAWDTSMVAEYGDEIFQYMRELEIKMLPNPHYMDNQNEIQWSMRSLLMDWLIQVHHRFNLLPETLFLCVNYIDRFLSAKIVSLGRLQLVGATAIFIAAKYEEINCPSIQEIVFMVDGGYTVDDILKAERFMLSMLKFQLGWPGPMSFLRRISKADDYDLETRTLAKYFLEITVIDERFVGSPPSFTAAGAHCLARLMLRKGDWSQAHAFYSNYTWSQLHSLVSLILECCEDPQRHHSAVFEKYCDKRFKRASLFVESEMKKGFNLEQVLAEFKAESSRDSSAIWRR